MSNNYPSESYFNQVADQWDNLRSGYFTEAVREAAIAMAYLHPEMVVADVGSGTGFIAAGLAPLVRQVHVLDGSAAMLGAARRNLAQFHNVEFHQADGLSLPLPDASVDAVFANMYLHHCPNPLSSITEMVRILRPGGRLILTDMDAHTHEWMKEGMSDLWLGFERDQVEEWSREAGLVNIIVNSTGQSCQSGRKSESGLGAEVDIFVAVGARRITARDMVQASYGTRAQESSGCCDDGACCTPGLVSLEDISTVNWDGGYSPSEL